jgi:hypothetical protein
VGLAAAHHADVRADRDGLEAEPFERAHVRAVLGPVARIEAGVVAVAAVGVLHDELADADQPAPGAWLVAPLGLEVVDLQRQLAIRLHHVGQQEPHDLLVGHGQDHVPAVAILEPAELRPDGVVPAARPPDVGRVDDRHLHLLPTDPVLLLTDDLLDPRGHPLAQRQQRVDARSELAQVARPQEQAVGRHLGLGRVVTERGEEQVGESHGAVRIAATGPHAACRSPCGPHAPTFRVAHGTMRPAARPVALAHSLEAPAPRWKAGPSRSSSSS